MFSGPAATDQISTAALNNLPCTVALNFSGFQEISTLFPQFPPLSPNPTKIAKFPSGFQITPKFPKATTKKPMLSFTSTMFRGLHEDLRKTLKDLPISTPSVLRNGLLEAHRNQSDYYYKFDQKEYIFIV
ncbi:hypothetical protein B0H14DRAFT_3454890 [Mycena olivaceomarginata]|nr:hypothetical protein B0H14DRAFT_3454890 [Mycena olivaceomarginata]